MATSSVMYLYEFTGTISSSASIQLTRQDAIPSGKVLGGFSITFAGMSYTTATSTVSLYNGNSSSSGDTIYSKSKSWNTSQGIDVSSTDSSYNKSKFTGSNTVTLKLNSSISNSSGHTGIIRVTFTYYDPTITWSNPTLSLSQSTSTRQVTATMGGTATHSEGSTVSYYLYEGSTVIGQFNNNKLIFTPAAGSHTYKTVAIAGGISADGASTSITVVDPSLTWSNASLTVVQSQSSMQVTATMGGTATHNMGTTVTYYLYEGSSQIGVISNGTLSFTPTAGEHTYKTVAVSGGLSADGATTTVVVVAATLTWENAFLFLVQIPDTLNVTATMYGTATHSFGATVTYYLYEGDTQIGQFSSSDLTFVSTPGTHTFKTVASAGGLTAVGATTSIVVENYTPPVPDDDTVGYYDGTNFIECEMYRYTDGAFVQVEPYRYNGSEWDECSQ